MNEINLNKTCKTSKYKKKEPPYNGSFWLRKHVTQKRIYFPSEHGAHSGRPA